MIRQFPLPHGPLDGSVEDTPLVQLLYALLSDSLTRGCERLHVMPPKESETFSVLAYARGSWEQVMAPTAKMYAAFVQRLKVMAAVSLARRLPVEHGRFRFARGGSVFEIGVTVRTAPDGSEDAMIELPAQPVAREE